MADPPSYEESTSEPSKLFDDSKTDPKAPLHFCIREQVGASRSQHVAALVAKLLPSIRSRAKQGLSKSNLLLLPSNQDASRKGRLVGFPEDGVPLLVQLEGCQDTMEFWTQEEARNELQRQLLAGTSDDLPGTMVHPHVTEQSGPAPIVKSSFFGRKQSKAPVPVAPSEPMRTPVVVDVQLEEAHFRAETEFGLYETRRCRALLVTIDVR